jgi:hypothetical protein
MLLCDKLDLQSLASGFGGTSGRAWSWSALSRTWFVSAPSMAGSSGWSISIAFGEVASGWKGSWSLILRLASSLVGAGMAGIVFRHSVMIAKRKGNGKRRESNNDLRTVLGMVEQVRCAVNCMVRDSQSKASG